MRMLVIGGTMFLGRRIVEAALKAITSGLTFRPLIDTVRDILEWDRTRRRQVPLNAGLAAGREHELLEHAPHPAR